MPIAGMANLDCQLGGIGTHPGDTAVVVSVRALQRGLTEGRRASQREQRLLAGGLSIKRLEEKAVCLPSLLPAELGHLSQRLWFFLDTSPCFFCLLCGLHTCSSLGILRASSFQASISSGISQVHRGPDGISQVGESFCDIHSCP